MTDEGQTLISTLEQLEALANPLRTRILRYAGGPITVAELAERLGVPKTRLYYHVNLLVETELMEQVDSRKSGARIERIYQRTAGDYQLSPEVARSVGDERRAAELATSVIVEPARVEIEDSIQRVLQGLEPAGTFSRTMARLADSDVQRFTRRLQKLVTDIREASRPNDEPAQLFAMTAALVPIEEGENDDNPRSS